jgi:hypothetical protein
LGREKVSNITRRVEKKFLCSSATCFFLDAFVGLVVVAKAEAIFGAIFNFLLDGNKTIELISDGTEGK